MKAIKVGLNPVNIPEENYIDPEESFQIYSGFRNINQRLVQKIKEDGISVRALVAWIDYAGLNNFNSITTICNFVRWYDGDVSKPLEQRKIVHLKFSVALKYNKHEVQTLISYLMENCDTHAQDEIELK